MSEEELAQDEENSAAGSNLEEAVAEQGIVDFEQNGLLLKIATNGIAVLDYVKRLKENDILVAVDGEVCDMQFYDQTVAATDSLKYLGVVLGPIR